MFRASRIAAGLIVMSALVLGCSSSGKQAPERAKAVASLKDVHSEFEKVKSTSAEVSRTLAALDTAPDTKKAYADFSSAVGKADSAAEATRARWQDMKDRGVEYRARWEAEVGEITDPAIKSALEERRKKVAENYNAITTAAQSVRDAYSEHSGRIHQIQKALAIDPTPAAVAALKPSIEQAQASTTTLNARIADLQQAVAEVMPDVAPPVPTK